MRGSYIRVIIHYLSFCNSIARKQGVKGLVLYLKQAYLHTVHARAHNPGPSGSIRFRRGQMGLPSVIPVLHRRRIISGDVLIFRFW
jgi:hypothetical protein